jgi:hypothetical protein
MADVLGLDPETSIERLLKRKDNQETTDVPRDQSDPTGPPGPHLRADIIQDRNLLPRCLSSQEQVKVREVHKNEQIGARVTNESDHAPVCPPEGGELPDDLSDAHHRKLSSIGVKAHPRLPHSVTPNSFNREMGRPAQQLLNYARCMEVS